MRADQITAKDKEKIDTDPAEAVYTARQFESEKRCVIYDDNNDCECAEKIETRLAFAILKARIDYDRVKSCSVAHELTHKIDLRT